jgi:hypothetical protein
MPWEISEDRVSNMILGKEEEGSVCRKVIHLAQARTLALGRHRVYQSPSRRLNTGTPTHRSMLGNGPRCSPDLSLKPCASS